MVCPPSSAVSRRIAPDTDLRLAVLITTGIFVQPDNGPMASCACAVGQPAGGNFLPGHDQRLRLELDRRAEGLLKVSNLLWTLPSSTWTGALHLIFSFFAKSPICRTTAERTTGLTAVCEMAACYSRQVLARSIFLSRYRSRCCVGLLSPAFSCIRTQTRAW